MPTLTYPMPIIPSTVVTSLKASTETNFEGLMEVAVGDKSIYRTAIDKIEAISINSTDTGAGNAEGDQVITDGQFSPSEKAKMIAELAAQIVPSITNAAMQTAYAMAKEDRDAMYQYPVMEADVQAKNASANKVEKDAEMVQANVYKSYHESLIMQGTLKQDYGMTTTPWIVSAVVGKTITLGEGGTKYYDSQSKAAQGYYTYARSLRENGKIDVSTTNGEYKPDYSAYTEISASSSEYDIIAAGLTANQARVQWRTYDGFDDNMVQHGVNASANMVATMFTEDASACMTKEAVCGWKSGATKLGLTFPTGFTDCTTCTEPAS